MFDTLSDRLQDAFKNLTGKGTLTDENIKDAMKSVRLALLEADVGYDVVKEFISDVQATCLGEKVLRSVSPGQQAVKAVHDRLVTLMGDANVPMDLSKGSPATIMMIGLHGSGKTTTTGKLARLLKSQGKRPLLVAADVHRPAAIDQLEFLGTQVGVEVFSQRGSTDVIQITNAARQHARQKGCNVMLVDTAGRLQIDDSLVQELVRMRDVLQPNEILLVGDSALGQEAVSVAKHFNDALSISGIVLTKLDGDSRGGAALSMRHVTGQPIKFIGVGEKLEDLEPFHPERMASRILGMGDVVSLVEKAQEAIDEKDAKRLEQRMLKQQFDFNDFLDSLAQLSKLGGLGKVLNMVPGGRDMLKGASIDEKALTHVKAMIHSMTPNERENPDLLGSVSRRQRIARGSGRSQQEVDGLIKRFDAMKQTMSGISSMPMFGGVSSTKGHRGRKAVSQKAKKAARKKKGRRR
jgi:signal recognition particle subunit SRP54